MTQSAYAAIASGDAGTSGPLRGARTLIIEDSAILATELVELLAEFGCRIIGPATTASAVKALLAGAEVDAAVVDINLNGLRTFEPAALLAARRIPFVFVSGYSEASVPPEFAAVRFLRKPVDPATLAAAVGEAVQSSINTRRSRIASVR
jgi:CheY-like chemotaxis protein